MTRRRSRLRCLPWPACQPPLWTWSVTTPRDGRPRSHNGFEEARQSYSRAVELDPKFGIGYQALAGVSLNLGNQQDAEKYIKEALRYLEGMTERERYTTRAGFYLMTGDYPQCVKEYGDLTRVICSGRRSRITISLFARYICETCVRPWMKCSVWWPSCPSARCSGSISRCTRTMRAISRLRNRKRERSRSRTLKALLALAFAQLGQGQLPQAMDTYRKLGTIRCPRRVLCGVRPWRPGHSRRSFLGRNANSGAGRGADLTSKNADRAASKFAALAHAEIGRGQNARSDCGGRKSVGQQHDAVKIRFLAARVFVEADEARKADPLIAGLASELQAEPQAYAKIVEGELALKMEIRAKRSKF